MTKFKRGDRVRVLPHAIAYATHYGLQKTRNVGIVDEDGSDCPYVLFDYISNRIALQNDQIKLIQEHTPITPKVGERYRVLKPLRDLLNDQVAQTIVCITYTFRDGTYGVKGHDIVMKKDCLTTEYLELVEEPQQGKSKFAEMQEHQDSIARHYQAKRDAMLLQMMSREPQPIKQSLITKSMNFIKSALLSKEDKTLIKANYLNDDLSLTCTGKAALEFINFKENKAALVTMAEEALAEEAE